MCPISLQAAAATVSVTGHPVGVAAAVVAAAAAAAAAVVAVAGHVRSLTGTSEGLAGGPAFASRNAMPCYASGTSSYAGALSTRA